MENHKEINVASQESDPESILSFYRQLLALRQKFKSSLIFGTFEVLDRENEKTFTYLKKGKDETLLVALNFSDAEQKAEVPDDATLVVSSAGKGAGGEGDLKPYEGRIYRIV